MPNASAYNPDPTQGQAKSVRNARVGGGKSIRRTSDDAKYVPHTRIPSKHPTERCPTRDDRYRQDLHARAGGGGKKEQNKAQSNRPREPPRIRNEQPKKETRYPGPDGREAVYMCVYVLGGWIEKK